MARSKFSDINALLDHAVTSYGEIERQYNEALHQKQVPPTLQIEIKNFLQNLRSVLDYLGQRVPGFERNYPMCNHINQTANSMRGASVASADAMTKWQPFNQPWLESFNWLNNEHKHQMLVPQTKTERVTTEAKSAGGSVTWDPGSVTFGSGVFIEGKPVNVHTQMPAGATITRTIWIDFHFQPQGSPNGIQANASVLPFLKECLDKIPQIVGDVEVTIP